MRRLTIIITGILILGACIQESTNHSIIEKIVINEEKLFEQWLAKHNLNKIDFKDTIGSEASGLWLYDEPIEKSDSLMYWYPSNDSSYYLVTNYNVMNGSRMELDWNNIRLEFHKTGTSVIRQGILLLDSLSERKIDFHWRDESSIYILESYSEESNYYLMLLNMENDSILKYKTKK